MGSISWVYTFFYSYEVNTFYSMCMNVVLECMSAPHVYLVPEEVRREHQVLELELVEYCKPPCGC